MKTNKTDDYLTQTYRLAAELAHRDQVDPGCQEELTWWVRDHCSYRPDTEYFLVLGIGSELADIAAREQGFESEVDRAYQAAEAKTA